MTKQEAEGFVEVVGSTYDKPFSPGAKEDIVEKILPEPVSSARGALKWLESHHADFRPNPLKLIKIVRDIGAEQRQKESTQRRQIPDDLPSDTTQSKQAVMLMIAIQSGKISRGKFLQGMQIMAEQYPNAGWGKCVTELTSFYRKNNHDLSLGPKGVSIVRAEVGGAGQC